MRDPALFRRTAAVDRPDRRGGHVRRLVAARASLPVRLRRAAGRDRRGRHRRRRLGGVLPGLAALHAGRGPGHRAPDPERCAPPLQPRSHARGGRRDRPRRVRRERADDGDHGADAANRDVYASLVEDFESSPFDGLRGRRPPRHRPRSAAAEHRAVAGPGHAALGARHPLGVPRGRVRRLGAQRLRDVRLADLLRPRLRAPWRGRSWRPRARTGRLPLLLSRAAERVAA